MIARQTAIPCTLQDVRDGRFVQHPELPSGVETPRGMLSRVNVLGVIVEKQGPGFAIDDGTARLAVRSFDPAPRSVPEVGELVLVIGRPREYDGERYLALEICKRVRNRTWVEYRKRELALLKPVGAKVGKPVASEAPVEVEVFSQEKNPFELIVERIRELDDGKGADVQELLDGIDHPEKERLLRSLLEEGEIFEMRPGKVKVLE